MKGALLNIPQNFLRTDFTSDYDIVPLISFTAKVSLLS